MWQGTKNIAVEKGNARRSEIQRPCWSVMIGGWYEHSQVPSQARAAAQALLPPAAYHKPKCTRFTVYQISKRQRVPVDDKHGENRRLWNKDVIPEPHESKEKDRGLLPPFSRVGLHHFPIIPKMRIRQRHGSGRHHTPPIVEISADEMQKQVNAGRRR